VIFGALFFAFRAGFEAMRKDGKVRKLAIITAVFLFVGGIILGPIMQKYAFDAYWTGFPVGKDLTDTKTLFALLAWIVALVAGRGGKPARGWYLAAFLLTLIVFIIPHSVLGSELDYSTMDQAAQALPETLNKGEWSN
jgi:ABC-type transport system involved in cytochrome c biogenesis permease subunit